MLLGCSPALLFLPTFHKMEPGFVRGCHAPVVRRQGTAEASDRAPACFNIAGEKMGCSGTLGHQIERRTDRETCAVFFHVLCDLGISVT